MYENSLTQKPPAIKIFQRDAHYIVEGKAFMKRTHTHKNKLTRSI